MYTFKKEERLCNKKLIDELFHNGSSFLCYPYRVSWLAVNESAECMVQVLIAVPKKRYKRAVDRNLVKRRIREAYRLNKQEHLYNLLTGADKKIVFSVGYIGKEIEPYPVMKKKMLKLLKQLVEQVAAA
jgi:ribonuclease P protein component